VFKLLLDLKGKRPPKPRPLKTLKAAFRGGGRFTSWPRFEARKTACNEAGIRLPFPVVCSGGVALMFAPVLDVVAVCCTDVKLWWFKLKRSSRKSFAIQYLQFYLSVGKSLNDRVLTLTGVHKIFSAYSSSTYWHILFMSGMVQYVRSTFRLQRRSTS